MGEEDRFSSRFSSLFRLIFIAYLCFPPPHLPTSPTTNPPADLFWASNSPPPHFGEIRCAPPAGHPLTPGLFCRFQLSGSHLHLRERFRKLGFRVKSSSRRQTPHKTLSSGSLTWFAERYKEIGKGGKGGRVCRGSAGG